MKILKAALVIWRRKCLSKQFFVSINANDVLSPKAILLIVRLSFLSFGITGDFLHLPLSFSHQKQYNNK